MAINNTAYEILEFIGQGENLLKLRISEKNQLKSIVIPQEGVSEEATAEGEEGATL